MGRGIDLWAPDRSYNRHFGSYPAVVWKVTGSSSRGAHHYPGERGVEAQTRPGKIHPKLFSSLVAWSLHTRQAHHFLHRPNKVGLCRLTEWVLHMSTRGWGGPNRRPSLWTQQIRGLPLQPAVTSGVWDIIIIVLICTKVTSSALVKKTWNAKGGFMFQVICDFQNMDVTSPVSARLGIDQFQNQSTTIQQTANFSTAARARRHGITSSEVGENNSQLIKFFGSSKEITLNL